ncbi:polymeric immunoglobulin receptor-like isoform X2 [Lates japonicus]|nr:polymeric immunoglobulin receptor-like isoform X2 [Lates japonicus]
MMKSFLLLILSLMTACGDDHDVKGCSEGWVEFSCKHPERKGKYQNIRVVTPTDTTIQSKKNDMATINTRTISCSNNPVDYFICSESCATTIDTRTTSCSNNPESWTESLNEESQTEQGL